MANAKKEKKSKGVRSGTVRSATPPENTNRGNYGEVALLRGHVAIPHETKAKPTGGAGGPGHHEKRRPLR